MNNPKYVLLLDSDPATQKTNHRHMAEAGYHVLHAADIETAQSMYQSDPELFDVIVARISEDQSGIKFIRAVRNGSKQASPNRDVACIFITDRPLDQTVREELNIATVLEPPYSGRDIRAGLIDALKGQRRSLYSAMSDSDAGLRRGSMPVSARPRKLGIGTS